MENNKKNQIGEIDGAKCFGCDGCQGIPPERSEKNQTVKIDRAKCIGCGVCQSICPEGFEMVAGKSKIKNANAECIKQAARACPVAAITLE